MLRSVKAVAALAAASAVLCTAESWARSRDNCADYTTPQTIPYRSFLELQLDMTAGQALTFTVVSGTPLTFTVPRAANISLGQSVTFAAATTGIMQVAATSPDSGQVSLVCGVQSGQSGATSPTQQTINNAQAAIANGQIMIQNYTAWITNGLLGSFGLLNRIDGGGNSQIKGISSEAPAPRPQPQAQTPMQRLEQLRREELSLRQDLEERPGDPELERRIAAVRRDVAFARLTASVAPGGATDRDAGRRFSAPVQERTMQVEAELQRRARAAETAPTADGERPQSAPTSFSLGSRDLIEMCDSEIGQFNPASELLGRKWNVWMEGRLVGAWDSLAQTNSGGFVGSAGVDYKVQPWLAVGMSVGVETFETKFGFNGIRLGSVGLSAVPYLGFRLTDNVFASLFVGLTQITYNSSPQLGATANFTALRVMFGGSLFGSWQAGDWQIKPVLSATYGSENQNGYTDSLGNVVSGQTVSYGRISAGPEVGYTFHGPDRSWSVQPYVLAKANLDFASSNASLLQGQSVVLRPGTLGSGSAGLGVDSRFSSGFYLRVQGSYDSIGVTGLDVLSGLIRGGYTF